LPAAPKRLSHDHPVPPPGDEYRPPENPCTRCELRADTLADGRCAPGDACLFVDNGRQIDRFLRRNREWAERCLHDAFWERRAIAVKWAPVEAVGALMDDPDEVVRLTVATRVGPELLARLTRDPDREVRIAVASRLPPPALERMARDPDYAVRLQVARRLPHGRLPRMADDPDREVRKEVARRLPAFALGRMARDEDAEVRGIAAARMLPEDAARLLADPEWTVRLAAAGQAPPEALAVLLDDPEPDVRELVRERLAQVTSPTHPPENSR